jgi:hypothetical protein
MIVHEKEEGEPSALPMHTDPEEQPCPGCDDEHQAACGFVVCNQSHGTQSCAFCPEFPCAMITKFKDDEWDHHQVVLDNLKRIKEIGVEGWLKEQENYWKCPDCGARTKWYQRKCKLCGGLITNYM